MANRDETVAIHDMIAKLGPMIVVGFILLPSFPLLSYASAVEPLRAANLLSGTALYEWWHASPDGAPVAASNGVVVMPDARLGDAALAADRVFACAGGNPSDFHDAEVFAWLRRAARHGTAVGGISGGPYVLANAGLLEARRCTVHWEHVPAFAERFPTLDVVRSLFEIDRGTITCSGGTAALDLMLHFVAEDHGAVLAAEVGDWFLHDRIREGVSPQRMPTQMRFDTRDPRLIRVLEAMERSIEEPKRREVLADIACLSVRQLERLARHDLGVGLHRHYLRLRLAQVARLRRETSLADAQIAEATGFRSASEMRRAMRRSDARR